MPAILTDDDGVMAAAAAPIRAIYTIVSIVSDLVHGCLDPRSWEQLCSSR
jgi:hypothetical protein